MVKESNLTLLVQDVTDVKEFSVDLGEHIVVMNKCDLKEDLPSHENKKFYVSSTTGQGVQDLLKAITAAWVLMRVVRPHFFPGKGMKNL